MADNNSRTAADSSQSISSSGASSSLGQGMGRSLSDSLGSSLGGMAASALGAPSRSNSKSARKAQEEQAQAEEKQYTDAVAEAAAQGQSQSSAEALSGSRAGFADPDFVQRAMTLPESHGESSSLNASRADQALASALQTQYGLSQSAASSLAEAAAQSAQSTSSTAGNSTSDSRGQAESSASQSSKDISDSVSSAESSRDNLAHAMQISLGVGRAESLEIADALVNARTAAEGAEQSEQSSAVDRVAAVLQTHGISESGAQALAQALVQSGSLEPQAEQGSWQQLSPQAELALGALNAATDELNAAYQDQAYVERVQDRVQAVADGSADRAEALNEIRELAVHMHSPQLSQGHLEVAEALENGRVIDGELREPVSAAQHLSSQLLEVAESQTLQAQQNYSDTLEQAREAGLPEPVNTEFSNSTEPSTELRDVLAARASQDQAAQELSAAATAMTLADEVLAAERAGDLSPQDRQEYAQALNELAESAGPDLAPSIQSVAHAVQAGDATSLQAERGELAEAYNAAAAEFNHNEETLQAATAQLTPEAQAALAAHDTATSLASDTAYPPQVNLEALNALSDELGSAALPEQQLQALESIRGASEALAQAAAADPDSPESGQRAALADAFAVDAPQTATLQEALAVSHYLEQVDSSALSEGQRQDYAQRVEDLADRLDAAHPDGSAQDTVVSLKELSTSLAQGDAAEITAASQQAAQAADTMAVGLTQEVQAQLSSRMAEPAFQEVFNAEASMQASQSTGNLTAEVQEIGGSAASVNGSEMSVSDSVSSAWGHSSSDSVSESARSTEREEAAEAEQEMDMGD